MMNILFSAGGTLGHIYPAIALINEYVKNHPDDNIYLLTNLKDKEYIENTCISKNTKIIFFSSDGISKSLIKLMKSIVKNIKTYRLIKEYLKENKIDVVVGLGGYISGITIKAAKKVQCQTIIHEQNSVMGLANKLSLKYTDILLTTFPMKKFIKNQYIVGNPRYYDAIKYRYNHLKTKYNILIISGTLGAEAINQIAIKFLNSSFSKSFTTTLITGKRYFDEVQAAISPQKHFQILPFSNDLLSLMSRSGIIISRSGSTSIFEILGCGSIPIFIPSPNVTKNHQYYNAKAVIDLGLGYMIEEKMLNLDLLITKISQAINEYESMINKIINTPVCEESNDMFKYIKLLKEIK